MPKTQQELPSIFVNTVFLKGTGYRVQFPVLSKLSGAYSGKSCLTMQRCHSCGKYFQENSGSGVVPRIVPGRDFESIVFVSLLRKKRVFHLPDFSGAFSPSRFFRKLLSRKLKQLPEQSQTVCKLWLSQRSIFWYIWCTTASNAGDTFCPLVFWCVTTHHTENWGRTQKKKTILTVNLYFCWNLFLDVYGNP